MSAPCPIFGFVLYARLLDSSADVGALRASLAEFLDANGLDLTSSGAVDCVVTREGSQTTNSDRELVLEWAARWAHVATIDVSDLIDLQRSS